MRTQELIPGRRRASGKLSGGVFAVLLPFFFSGCAYSTPGSKWANYWFIKAGTSTNFVITCMGPPTETDRLPNGNEIWRWMERNKFRSAKYAEIEINNGHVLDRPMEIASFWHESAMDAALKKKAEMRNPAPTTDPDRASLLVLRALLNPSEIYLESRPNLPSEVRKAIVEKKVRPGMTKDQVLVSWGEPEDKEVLEDAPNSREKWRYGALELRFHGDVLIDRENATQ